MSIDTFFKLNIKVFFYSIFCHHVTQNRYSLQSTVLLLMADDSFRNLFWPNYVFMYKVEGLRGDQKKTAFFKCKQIFCNLV